MITGAVNDDEMLLLLPVMMMMMMMMMWCRQAELRGSSSLHPGTVRGEEQEHDKGGLLPSDMCHRHEQHPVCLWCRYWCNHCQQPAWLWPLLTSVLQSCHANRLSVPNWISTRCQLLSRRTILCGEISQLTASNNYWLIKSRFYLSRIYLLIYFGLVAFVLLLTVSLRFVFVIILFCCAKSVYGVSCSVFRWRPCMNFHIVSGVLLGMFSYVTT